MSKNKSVFILVASLTVLEGGATLAEERLLPASTHREVSVTMAQEGKALEVALENNSKLVITAVKLDCHYSDNRAGDVAVYFQCMGRTPKSRQSACLDKHNSNFKHHFPEKLEAALNILPGKSSTLIFQLPDDTRVTHCSLENLRGRDKKFYEF